MSTRGQFAIRFLCQTTEVLGDPHQPIPNLEMERIFAQAMNKNHCPLISAHYDVHNLSDGTRLEFFRKDNNTGLGSQICDMWMFVALKDGQTVQRGNIQPIIIHYKLELPLSQG